MKKKTKGQHAALLLLVLTMIFASACASTQPAPGSEGDEMRAIDNAEVERENATGSVGVMTRDQIKERNASDALQLFEGHFAGVRVVQTPNGPRLRIRGIRSLQGSRDPLIVLDGTPLPQDDTDGLQFLNPNDIDRIEVLKGASAAIYGVRGANGVVVISTRR